MTMPLEQLRPWMDGPDDEDTHFEKGSAWNWTGGPGACR